MRLFSSSSGLFQRAILMSGSALSPWAEVKDALSVTARMAKFLNCSLPTDLSNQHPETMNCLRNVSAQKLVTMALPQYKFTSLFGPSVDGVVVKEDFRSHLSSVSSVLCIYFLCLVMQYRNDPYFSFDGLKA